MSCVGILGMELNSGEIRDPLSCLKYTMRFSLQSGDAELFLAPQNFARQLLDKIANVEKCRNRIFTFFRL